MNVTEWQVSWNLFAACTGLAYSPLKQHNAEMCKMLFDGFAPGIAADAIWLRDLELEKLKSAIINLIFHDNNMAAI